MSPEHNTPSTHLTLLDGVRGGEVEAWARFFDHYAPVILRWCRRRGLADADADDVLQTLMRDAPRKLAAYHREDADGAVRRFRPWLRTVVANLVADHHRDRQRKPGNYGHGADDRGGAFAALTAADTDDIADEIATEHGADLDRVVAAVRGRLRGEGSWAIYQARALDGQPVGQVAEAHGTTVGAVFQAVNRINGMLAEEYRKLFPERTPPNSETPDDVPG